MIMHYKKREYVLLAIILWRSKKLLKIYFISVNFFNFHNFLCVNLNLVIFFTSYNIFHTMICAITPSVHSSTDLYTAPGTKSWRH